MNRTIAMIDWLMPVLLVALVVWIALGDVTWVVAGVFGWLRVFVMFGVPLFAAYLCGRSHGGHRRAS